MLAQMTPLVGCWPDQYYIPRLPLLQNIRPQERRLGRGRPAVPVNGSNVKTPKLKQEKEGVREDTTLSSWSPACLL